MGNAIAIAELPFAQSYILAMNAKVQFRGELVSIKHDQERCLTSSEKHRGSEIPDRTNRSDHRA